MAEPRKYREDEVREIFGLAARRTNAEPRPLAAAEGLTLAEIKDIGREVGLESADIARAASAIDARTTPLPRRTSPGHADRRGSHGPVTESVDGQRVGASCR